MSWFWSLRSGVMTTRASHLPSTASLSHRRSTEVELGGNPRECIGYKDFTAFLSSDDDFFVLRRFDQLHARVLLVLQDNLVKIEEDIDELDQQPIACNASGAGGGTIRQDLPERKELLDSAHKKLREYDELLSAYLGLRARPRAPYAHSTNVKTWLYNRDNPISRKEALFVEAEDLIPVGSIQKPVIRQVFEQNVLLPITRWIRYVIFTNRASSVQISDRTADRIADLLLFLSTLAVLVVPLWILAGIQLLGIKLVVITAFLVGLLSVLIWGTPVKPFEVLAATAGYAAVLVVFLQIQDSPSTTSGQSG
ncbi:hypothetical protein MFIFM68171_02077 [Madurella fahalii]|uniref:DUF6594 domain-containing protein n=1 Tax=Madurella fahalii TaxID=1157608 RepID=A0ABQ0G2A5_9PEZI